MAVSLICKKQVKRALYIVSVKHKIIVSPYNNIHRMLHLPRGQTDPRSPSTISTLHTG